MILTVSETPRGRALVLPQPRPFPRAANDLLADYGGIKVEVDPATGDAFAVVQLEGEGRTARAEMNAVQLAQLIASARIALDVMAAHEHGRQQGRPV